MVNKKVGLKNGEIKMQINDVLAETEDGGKNRN